MKAKADLLPECPVSTTVGRIIRTVYTEVPLRVEYALSEPGRSLTPIPGAIKICSEPYKSGIRGKANG